MARSLLSGSFAGTGQSASVLIKGLANVVIDGGDGTVAIERSFDNGSTWQVASRDGQGNPASFATATNGFNGLIEEPEDAILYRLNCTAYASGTITYRISQ